jgi:hypothetical protein
MGIDDIAWQIGGKHDVVVNQVFEVDAGHARVGKQHPQSRFTLAEFVPKGLRIHCCTPEGDHNGRSVTTTIY